MVNKRKKVSGREILAIIFDFDDTLTDDTITRFLNSKDYDAVKFWREVDNLYPQYSKILVPYRRRPSSIERTLDEEFYSDRSRILFSSSFRRLLQKAQVFPLEPNSSVRTRLTHSLEVADIGKKLALKIAKELERKKLLSKDLLIPFVTIVENACLLHDVGNPPFGHFGEQAIQSWFREKWEKHVPACMNKKTYKAMLQPLLRDFFHFDGNPQGLRTVLRLSGHDGYGLNLSLPAILSSIKYTMASDSDELSAGKYEKKPGYFQTEKKIIQELCDHIGWDSKVKFPLAYIMDAADDICYCLSDIADGFEKGIMNSDLFRNTFKELWSEKYDDKIPVKLPAKIESFGMQISVPWSKAFVEEATTEYVNNHDKVCSGGIGKLIDKNGMGRVLNILKEIARNKIYRSPEAQTIELSGYTTVCGLLDHFSALLEMEMADFLVFVEKDRLISHEGLDLEWRLFNQLSKNYIKSYEYQLKEFGKEPTCEWFLRAHLIVDHISGMTDNFALRTYQILEGISINS